MTGEFLLETQGLRKAFGGVVALDGVDFRLRQGEIRALIGPNGAGKTTLINVITGLLPPTGGTVRLDRRDITGWSPERISRLGVARTFQLTAIFPGCSVADNVLVAVAGAVRAGRTGRGGANEPTVREILALTGLAPLASVLAANLSHGDQKLLELALALALRPAVLFLDEPTAGMSLAETRRAVKVIQGLRDTTTIVVVEHDIEVVMRVSDRITVLSNGRILAEGPPEAIRANEQVREVYLGR
jgi:branched-chain amino acid transport system ATP-binding protein